MPFRRRPRPVAPADPVTLAQDLAAVLMAQREELSPLFDAAEGVRADLVKRGWSEAIAEQVASVWLLGNLGPMMTA